MLVAARMPQTGPLMSHKKRLSNQLDSGAGIQVPHPKRRRVNSANGCGDDPVNNGALRSDDRQTMMFKMLPHSNTKSHTVGRNSHNMKEVQLSLRAKDPSLQSPCAKSKNGFLCIGSSASNKDSTLIRSNKRQVNGYKRPSLLPHNRKLGEETNEDGSYEKTKHELENPVEKLPSSDVDSDSGDYQQVSIPKMKINQPAVVLLRMDDQLRKPQQLSVSSTSHVVSSDISNVVLGGYVHRMANLNARACVAAFLRPEKRVSQKLSDNNVHKKIAGSVIAKSSVTYPRANHPEGSNSEAVVLNLNGIENAIPVIKIEGDEGDIPACAVLLQNMDARHNTGEDDLETSYNTQGLLYNGDTMHPDALFFLTQSPDSDLLLPERIIPTLVPTRLSTVNRAVRNAVCRGVMGRVKKKVNLKNNGWRPIGKPIKVIGASEGFIPKYRKYFAGIRRLKSEELFVRDTVIIKAGTEKDENPFVAKIGSIWQESNGYLYMTVFWYYTPSDAELQAAGVECDEGEILASQHYDTISVACIEDKCHVLGFSQFCRYHALVVKNTVYGAGSSKSIVPDLPLKPNCDHSLSVDDDDDDDTNLVELDPDKQQVEDTGPSLADLKTVNPSLVFLCYRGFDHISGTLQTRKPVLAKLD